MMILMEMIIWLGRKQFDIEEEATGVCFGILLIGGPI